VSSRVRPYLFYDVAVSICSTCYRKVEGKIVFQDDKVFLLKSCPVHGAERVLVADDVEYYRRCREVFIKPPEMPDHFNTPVKWGCPYDCGLCSDHEQHSCLTLLEICDYCNLRCPVCYASSGPERQQFRSLDEIARMLDAIVRNEGQPDVVQVSGGEPTMHPEFFRVLDMCKSRPIRHLMLNTNGVRIARNPGFAEQLAGYMPDFEVYLQFDSFEEGALREMRGEDMREVHEQALARLIALGISTTLVVTLKRGVNDHEIGKIIDFALAQPCVRGVTLQPVQHAGRTEHFDPARDRLTLTEVRRKILDQTSVFRPEDVVPVPCHPDALAMAYALKLPAGPAVSDRSDARDAKGPAVSEHDVQASRTVPLTGLIDPQILIEGGRNTIVYEQDEAVHAGFVKLFATNHSPASSAGALRDLLCCLPTISAPTDLGYANLFRVLIVQFIDAHAFDVRSVKKSCIHIVHPDGRLIPFDTYNLFYRDGLESEVLGPLRAGSVR
jgi:uncharacterized radical SAM superfamily Fe-S cluster-containing enzyme